MNRRDLIQALGLAPLAALAVPKVAHADVGQGLGEWGERKLFSITATLEGVTRDTLWDLRWRRISAAVPECLDRLSRVIRASTRTPDIMQDATIRVVGQGGVWGEFKTVPLSPLFRDAPEEVANYTLCAGRNQLVKEHPVPSGCSYHDHMLRLDKEGLLDEQYTKLSHVEIEFFYYGPTPYPHDGRRYAFNYERDTWEPVTSRG